MVLKEYKTILKELKERIHLSRQRAVLSVNKELILLYWEIGALILRNQEKAGWGAKIIDTLAKDLKEAFPEMKGLSSRNLKYMRKFAGIYEEKAFVQQAVAQLSWSHNLILMEKVKDRTIREWYIHKCIENGWSRNVMVFQIESDLYGRQGTAIKMTNFAKHLPPAQSELAEQTLKDPYIFDFLSIGEKAHERELEKALIKHITQFLLELGAGFAFMGNQYHLEVGGQDFYIDLLFYHIKLRCFVVIELKQGAFKPEHAGKMNFYLSAVDDLLKAPGDNPSIGIILCKEKNNIFAEYALKDAGKPMGISEYQIVKSIPQELKTSLPTIEELEAELNRDFEEGE